MPFQSEKQRRYMHANLPDIANRWEAKYGLGGVAGLNAQLNSLPEYYLPKNQGGLIPAHQAGIYGLAEGGKIIEGKPHQLSYITPGEAQTLQNLGGRKVMTPEGIPAYPPWDNPPSAGGTKGETTSSDHGGPSGPPGGGATSMGSGRDYSPPPSDRQPGFETSNTRTTTPTSDSGGDGPDPHGGDWEEGWLNEDLKKVNEIINDPNANRRDKEQALVWKDQFNKQIRESQTQVEKGNIWKTIGNLAALYTGVGPLLGLQAPKAVQTVAQLNSLYKKIDNTISFGKKIGLINENITTDGIIKGVKDQALNFGAERRKKMDLYNSLPAGHPEKIALSVELEIGKKPEHLRDNGGTEETSIKIENIEDVNQKKMELASYEARQIQEKVENAKRNAYLAAFRQKYLMGPTAMAAGGGRVPAGYNTGGLSNLFRLKNV